MYDYLKSMQQATSVLGQISSDDEVYEENKTRDSGYTECASSAKEFLNSSMNFAMQVIFFKVQVYYQNL